MRVSHRLVAASCLCTVLVAGCGETGPGDITPPSVAIIDPPGGDVTGAITIQVQATDDGGIDRVLFRVNGNQVGAPDTVAPYEYDWDPAVSGAGTYVWLVFARDRAGNSAASAPVTYRYFPTP